MFKEVALIFKRNLAVSVRNPIRLAIGLFQPFCYLVLFAPLLKTISNFNHTQGNHLTVFIPGLLIMLAFYGSAFVGFSLIDDWRTGYLERLWVSPISRFAMIAGRTLHDILIVLFQSTVLVALSFLFGLQANIYGVMASFILVALVSALLSSFSYILALAFKEESVLAGMINLILLPVQLLSGITLPLSLAPFWIQTASKANPLAHAVAGARSLFVGNFTDWSVIVSFALLSCITFLTFKSLVKTYLKQAV